MCWSLNHSKNTKMARDLSQNSSIQQKSRLLLRFITPSVTATARTQVLLFFPRVAGLFQAEVRYVSDPSKRKPPPGGPRPPRSTPVCPHRNPRTFILTGCKWKPCSSHWGPHSQNTSVRLMLLVAHRGELWEETKCGERISEYTHAPCLNGTYGMNVLAFAGGGRHL